MKGFHARAAVLAFWVGLNAFSMAAVRANSFGEAVDNPDVFFTTTGNSGWFVENWRYYSGGDALQSGPIGHDEVSDLETRLEGPGVVRFYWRVSSQINFDFLSFYVDNDFVGRISGEVGWEQVTYSLGPGVHRLQWVYSTNPSYHAQANAGWIDYFEWIPDNEPGDGGEGPVVSLEEALDAPALVWSSGGDFDWYGQTVVAYDGADAAESPFLGHDQSAWIKTTLIGPGILRFYWRISSEEEYDFLRFLIDDVEQRAISGDQAWVYQSYSIPDAVVEVKWIYETDSSVIGGANRAWVDHVTFTPPAQAGAPGPTDGSLADALDNTELNWSTWGTPGWFAQTLDAWHDGDAARSGAIGHEQAAVLETSVTGPGEISFDWKVSSEPYYDVLTFYVDDLVQDYISGERDWSYETYPIGPGDHLLRWSYEKDRTLTAGQDAAWVDHARWRPSSGGALPADGSTDLVWRHRALGQVAIWLMQGEQAETSTLTIPPQGSDLDWRIVGAGDFNQDGKQDLVWQHDELEIIGFWFMNGQAMVGTAEASPNKAGAPGWRIVGVDDFNRDGKPDLVWQHEETQDAAVWYMNGTQLVQGTLFAPRSGGYYWRLRGTGDFNNDGYADLVWQFSDDSWVAVWMMNGHWLSSSTYTYPSYAGYGWEIVDASDFNSDGRADLLFQNDSGLVNIWRMSGTYRVDSVYTDPSSPENSDWRVEALGDFALLDLDSDDDGLVDSWELEHFGDLDQSGEGDYDGDGRSNADEFGANSDPLRRSTLAVFTPLEP